LQTPEGTWEVESFQVTVLDACISFIDPVPWDMNEQVWPPLTVMAKALFPSSVFFSSNIRVCRQCGRNGFDTKILLIHHFQVATLLKVLWAFSHLGFMVAQGKYTGSPSFDGGRH
jgi:hypothetical protein